MYDTVITNGTVVDGSGNARFEADVAIKDGCIVGVGNYSSSDATQTIDASGCAAKPSCRESLQECNVEYGCSLRVLRRYPPHLISLGRCFDFLRPPQSP